MCGNILGVIYLLILESMEGAKREGGRFLQQKMALELMTKFVPEGYFILKLFQQ